MQQQKSKRKLTPAETRKVEQQRERKLQQARKYLATVTIELRPDAPTTLEEYLEQHEYRRTTGFWAHCRHALTNYDEVCNEMTRRFPSAFWNLPTEHVELKIQAGRVVGFATAS